ncbi:MAG: D-aminoacyl-tRNA deacylase [Minisyncoccia bacterium]
MRILIQRVKDTRLYVKNKLVSKLDNGFLIFLGIENGDEEKIDKAIEKLLKIKIIEDENGRFKYSLLEKKFPLLVVSEITLIPEFEDNKPEFTNSPKKNLAEKIYLEFIEKLREKNFKVEEGIFGEFMEIENKNLGPVSFYLRL